MNKWVLSAFGDEIATALKDQLAVLKKHNIDHLEIRTVDNINILDLSNHQLQVVKEILNQFEIKISAIGSPIGKVKVTDNQAQHRQKFERALYVAKFLETKYIRIFSFFMKPAETGIHRDFVINELKHFADRAEEEGVVLLHENEKDIYGDTPERCLDILQTIDSPALLATFDCANFIQVQSESFPYAYLLLKDWVEYIHIKDARFKDRKVMPAGQGDANYCALLNQLHADNFEGFFSFEPHLTDENEPGGGEEKFEVAFTSFQKLLVNVKGVTVQ